jgi:hypothetical protein
MASIKEVSSCNLFAGSISQPFLVLAIASNITLGNPSLQLGQTKISF